MVILSSKCYQTLGNGGNLHLLIGLYCITVIALVELLCDMFIGLFLSFQILSLWYLLKLLKVLEKLCILSMSAGNLR